jgi:hypothetical protein
MEENSREEKRVVYLSYYGNPGVGKKKTNNGWSSIAEGQPKTPDRTLRPRKPKPVHTPNPVSYGRKAREQPQPLRLLPDAALEGSRSLATSVARTDSD